MIVSKKENLIWKNDSIYYDDHMVYNIYYIGIRLYADRWRGVRGRVVRLICPSPLWVRISSGTLKSFVSLRKVGGSIR